MRVIRLVTIRSLREWEGKEMRFTHDGQIHVWNGSHTVNVYDSAGHEIDCWTLFPTDGRKPTELEILDALTRR